MESASSSTWTSLLGNLFSTDNNKEYAFNLKSLVKDILDDRLKFHECVEALGEYLTDTKTEPRAKGVQLLCDIIHSLPVAFLNSNEVNKLILFLSDRLQDHVSVVSQSLRGLHILTTRNNVSKEEIGLILKGIFHEVCTQSLEQKDRQYIFLILQNMLHFHLEALKSIGLDFISGFIQAIDGEKDPRNLAIVFSLTPIVIQNLNIDPFIEDLFEASACYFPVDYSPPPNDPRGIKKEDLVNGLRSVFASTSKFAEHLIPLLLEKLDSDLQSAKLDTLQTLGTCASVYGFENLKAFYSDIWKSIRREVFSAVNLEIENAALMALSAMIKTLDRVVLQRNSEDVGAHLLTDILEECLSYLSQSDMKFIHPTTKLLKATAIASTVTCERVLKAILPVLLNHYAVKTENHERRVLVEVINTFLEICNCMFSSVEDESPLAAYKNTLLMLYVIAVKESENSPLRQCAIEGLLILIQTHSLLNNDELLTVAQLLAKFAVEDDVESVRATFRNALSKMADCHSSLLMNSIIPDILQGIENGSFEKADNSDQVPETFERHLKMLIAIVRNDLTLATVTPPILSKLEIILQECNDVKVECILKSLHDIAKNQDLTLSSSEYWYRNVLLRLFQIISRHIKKWDPFDQLFVQNVAVINQTVVPLLNLRDSAQLMGHTLKAYSHSDSNDNFKKDDQIFFEFKLLPEPFMIMLTESVLNSIKKEIFLNNTSQPQVPMEYLYTFLKKAVTLTNDINSTDDLVLSAARSIASLINKIPDGDNLEQLVTMVYDCVQIENFGDPSLVQRIKQHRVQLLMWVTKALIMRGHHSTDRFISVIFSYLKNKSVSETTANGFQIILSDTSEALNSSLHARVALLYKQRFFISTSKQLIDGFHNANEGIANNFLTALVHQATRIPKEVFQSEASSMLPIFIRGLLSDNTTLLIAVLSTLLELLPDSPTLAESYIDTLISYLLNLSIFKKSMKVRILSLESLNCLALLPTHITLRHTQDVVQNLTAPLDDPKRLVRRAAMKTRSNWFLVGSPGGY